MFVETTTLESNIPNASETVILQNDEKLLATFEKKILHVYG